MVDPKDRFAMVFDGAGHGCRYWKYIEPPFFTEHLYNNVKVFLDTCDFSALSLDKVDEFCDKLYFDVLIPFSKKYMVELDNRTVDEQQNRSDFSGLIQQLHSEGPNVELFNEFMKKMGDNLDSEFKHNISEYQSDVQNKKMYHEVSQMMIDFYNLSSFDSFSKLFNHFRSLNDVDRKFVEDNYFRVFKRSLKPKHCKSDSPAAMAMVIPLYLKDINGVVMMRCVDVCTYIFEYTQGDDIKLRECHYRSNHSLSGLDRSHNDVLKFYPLPRGGVVFTFTDGIGEFMSQDDVCDIFQENYLKGPDELRRIFSEFITSGKGYKDEKCASYAGEKIKKYDENRITQTDDIGFYVQFIKPALI